MSISGIIDKILLKFGYSKLTDKEKNKIENNIKYSKNYENIDEINFNFIFSSKLSNYTTTDSNIEIVKKNNRDLIIEEIINIINVYMNPLISRVYGTGGVGIVPTLRSGELGIDFIDQEKITIKKIVNNKIKECVILADTITNKNNKQVNYFINYKILNVDNVNVLKVESFTFDSDGRETTDSNFEKIDYAISNVDIVPVILIKNPVNNKSIQFDYGLPITYGAETLIEDIKTTLKQIAKEFEKKEVVLFADETMFATTDKMGKVPANLAKVVVTTGGGKIEGENYLSIFSPEIRDSAYYNKLQNQFALLEKIVGTSKGILTEPDRDLTATEVKANMNSTYSIVNAMRKEIESKIKDLVYVLTVYINYLGLASYSENETNINFNWSYDLLENPQETLNQLVIGVNAGAISKEELRQFLVSGEDIETSKLKIKEIEENNSNNIF